MITITDSAPHSQSRVESMRRVYGHFKFFYSSVSGASVEFLDLDASLNKIVVNIRPSLSKTPSPLHTDSAHAPHVHNAWPRSLVKRIGLLAHPASQPAKDELIRVYEAGNANSYTIQIMSRQSPYPYSPRITDNGKTIAC
jgi:hypothetical protein